jgi:signal transduction histidine kinase
VEIVDVRIVLVLALALVLNLRPDDGDDEMVLDLVEELIDEQLDSAMLWHVPTLGIRANPVPCDREPVS